jgi:ubiquitin carboxyl-terminal hydrolase L5
MAENWTTIESDPGVFTELIEKFGVQNVGVEEIWSLDMVDESLKANTYGLIYLFKWRAEADQRPVVNVPEGLFFAKQVVQNACATQAILSVLMNSESIELGEDLGNFKSFAGAGIDSESLGVAIGSHDLIRTVHNSFARPDPFVADDEDKDNKKGKSEDVYHFVAYVTHNGNVYELDGLKPGPIFLGEVPSGQDLFSVARPAIETRMSAHNDITSCLLSIRKSKIKCLEETIAGCTDNDMLSSYELELEQEKENKKKAQEENVRRRHNFTPFVLTLLKALASKGKLQGMIDNAKARRETAMNAAAEAKKAESK